MERFCSQCGKPVREDDEFCIQCGFPVGKEEEPRQDTWQGPGQGQKAKPDVGFEREEGYDIARGPISQRRSRGERGADFGQGRSPYHEEGYPQEFRGRSEGEEVSHASRQPGFQQTSSRPGKKSPSGSTGKVLLIVLTVAIVLGIGFFLYKKYGEDKLFPPEKSSDAAASSKESSPPVQKKPSKKPVDKETKTASDQKESAKTNSAKENPATMDLKDPKTYLPTLNQKYVYDMHYPDGEEGISEIWAVDLGGKTLLTMITVVPESEGFADHVVQRKDGLLYLVPDYDFESTIQYFPAVIEKGATLEEGGVYEEILETDVSCDAGFKVFKHCIVIQRDFEEAGYRFKIWIAPGTGSVKAIDADSGEEVQTLTAIQDMTKEELEDVSRFAPNIGKVK